MTSLTIAYGRRSGPRSGHIREGRRGVANPSFTVRPNETPALRLNSDHGLRFPPEQLAQLPTNDDKLNYLRHEIVGALDLFAPHQRAFLDRYFEFITDRCQEAASELEKRLAWSGGLFEAGDFVFSALWPLPNAEVIVSGEAGGKSLGAYEFAFWDGCRVIGVTLTSRPARPGDAGASPVKPEANGIMPVTIVAGDLAREPGPFATPRFPETFLDFWRNEPFPGSPFRPEGLEMQEDVA